MRTIRITCCVLAAAWTVVAFLPAASAAPAYQHMAPASQYLMNGSAEIELARSAAPPAISKKATVLVLTAHGYVVASTGTNGFVCYVGRSWLASFDWPEYWNPHVRAAGCLNPIAARTIVPIEKLRAKLAMDGRSQPEMANAVKTALMKGEIPPLGSGGVSYMMSRRSYLQDALPHNVAHVMFYFPLDDAASLGAGQAGSPIIAGSYWYGSTETVKGLPPILVSIIGVNNWSDGSKV